MRLHFVLVGVTLGLAACASDRRPEAVAIPTAPLIERAPAGPIVSSPAPPSATLGAVSLSGPKTDLQVPDPMKTPGAVREEIDANQICTIKWGVDARHVSEAMKRQVFEAYGLSGNNDSRCVPDRNGRRCEIDHLVSRELGGADVVQNLWPEPYGSSPWNAALKDRLENRLHREVCVAYSISLDEARSLIVTDWRAAYVRFFGDPTTASGPGRRLAR